MQNGDANTERALGVLDELAGGEGSIICLSIRSRFDIQLEKRLSGVVGLRYIMLYGGNLAMVTCRDGTVNSGKPS